MLQLLISQPSPPKFLVVITLCLIAGLCSCSSQTISPEPQPTTEKKGSDNNFIFFNLTLEQADEVGRPIWSVKSKRAVYTKDKQIGKAENPYGELYQDGKVVYQIRAETADIRQDGKQLFLKGKIVATDPKNGVVLRGNELEWRPKEDLLIVRNQINGTHKQLQAVASEAKVKTRQQRIDFSGGVVATSVDPDLKIKTQHLIWQIKQDKLIADRSVQIDRYKNKQITDRGRGGAAVVYLKAKIAQITKNAEINLLEPPMQIASKAMTWNMNSEIVTSNTPVRVFHQTENVTVTGDRGELKIAEKIVYLTGNVHGVGQNRQSIKSQKLTWFLNKKNIEARGNVVYKQVKPPLTFNGDKAVGNLQTENIVVSGGKTGKRVVTEIVPQ
ncbi:LPS export ABC transporter periplasmic protein LptC [Calothrix rhizosoleniae]|uniref:LPS export ABC transporter periplasmic protein LptC n=1 Tax=Calothrix rhizosoleniae TaxID=888997 RepID=UPI000B4A18DF|nr:LPS export ABC transporter periplasmic protein LptC [Calothrix rhizosoleniae]